MKSVFAIALIFSLSTACATAQKPVSAEVVLAKAEPLAPPVELPGWITTTQSCTTDEGGEVLAVGVSPQDGEDDAHGRAIAHIIDCLRGSSVDEMEVVGLKVVPRVRKSWEHPVTGIYYVLASMPQDIY